MTFNPKYLIIVVLTALLCCNVYSQRFNASPEDPLYAEKLASFRQTIWDSLPAPVDWTNDFENLFSPAEQSKLDSVINQFEKETTIEIAIVTVDTMYVAKSNFDNLAFHIASTWKIGKKIMNNGMLIAISRGYRRIRIENGYGIEKLISDNETKEIIDDYFIPYFKEEKYFEGTMAGLTCLITLLKRK